MQKHEIVLRLNSGDPQTAISRDYGVKKQAIGYIKPNSKKILTAVAEGTVPKNGKTAKDSADIP